ncbi:MAG: hypothetical protein LBU61_00020 [Coriobacteriales bacterium]|jgi:hypothetical protein|nr:hypothetical protein [Coriobacteriales bacterium]
MNDNDTAIDKNKEVDFSYPEGFMEAAASLDFLPEEMRVPMLIALSGTNQ